MEQDKVALIQNGARKSDPFTGWSKKKWPLFRIAQEKVTLLQDGARKSGPYSEWRKKK
jgi:hypothetical protein